MDLSKGQEMLGWYVFCSFSAPMLTLLGRYSTAFVVCSLLHVFSRTSLDARVSGAKKQKGKESIASTALLQALEGKGARRSVRGEDVNSSDADGGIEGEESSNDDDYGTVESARGDKHRKHSPTTPSELPSSLMRALTAPPPSTLNLTSEDFIRDFLSKYPPSPKSYEVTQMIATLFCLHLPFFCSSQSAAKCDVSASRYLTPSKSCVMNQALRLLSNFFAPAISRCSFFPSLPETRRLCC